MVLTVGKAIQLLINVEEDENHVIRKDSKSDFDDASGASKVSWKFKSGSSFSKLW